MTYLIFKKFLLLLIFVFQLKKCNAAIYDLNDTEYDLMPPLFELDQYDACLRRSGTYCVAKFHLTADTDHALMTMIREYSMDSQKHFNHTYIERGVCITTKCRKFLENKDLNKEEDLCQVLEACQNETIWKEYGLQAKLSTIMSCDTGDKTMETDLSDWLLALVVVALVVMNVVGTFYDVVLSRKISEEEKNTSGNRTLLSFSLLRNWRWLTRANNDPDMERMKVFIGLKATASFFVIMAHVGILIYPSDNPHDFEKALDKWYVQIVSNGTNIVQLFFIMSGFLLIYNLEVRSIKDKVSWKLIPAITIYRWLRLTPVYALILAFTMTWLRHIGSGPLWYHVTQGLVKDCREYWWLHLFYVHNYNSDDSACILPAWHLATDTQLFILGLIIYVATARTSVNVRNWVLGLAVLVGMILPAIDVWRMDLNPIFILHPETFRALDNDTFYKIHIKGHNNIICFVIGMAVAHMVYARRNQRNNFLEHKITKLLTWLVVPAVVVLFISGGVFYGGPNTAMAVKIAYAAGSRLALGILMGFGIFSLTLKIDIGLRHFFEWKGWLVPGRLSFCVYLLHMNLIHIIHATRTQLLHVDSLSLTVHYLGVVLLSFLFALPLHLLVEAPFNSLLHHAFQVSKKSGKRID